MNFKEKINSVNSKLYLGASSAAMAMAMPHTVFADGFLDNIKVGENGQITGVTNGDTVTQGNMLMDKLKDVLGVVQGVAIVLCVIFLVVAGAQMAMSQGNSQKRQIAMEAIKNCAIGAAVTGGAALIIQIAYSFLL